VPTAFGKADLRIYKHAGDRVVAVLGRVATVTCEKQSVDEVALDVSIEALKRLHQRPFAELVKEVQEYSHLEGLPVGHIVDETQVG
jgi:hypothetical protein